MPSKRDVSQLSATNSKDGDRYQFRAAKKRHRLGLCLAGLLFLPDSSHARDLFEIRLTLPESGDSGFSSFDSAEDIIDEFENDFSSTLASYTQDSVAIANIDFRGVALIASFPEAGPSLRVQVPGCNFDQTFSGTTRNDSVNQFEDFFEQNNEDLLTCVAQDAVRNTPVDPVAGNPNSLMATMAASDFDMSFDTDQVSAEGQGRNPNVGRLGLQFGRFSSGGFDGNNYTIPLRYTHSLNGGYGIVIDAPVNMLTVSGARAYSGSFGVGVRLPLTEQWSLTPVARFGAVGSMDFASASFIYSAAMSSRVSFDFDNFGIDVGNMFGFYQTGSVSVGDYESDYDLTNYLSRHGLRVSGDLPFSVFGRMPNSDLSVVRTDFLGDDLFISGYTDISASIAFPGTISGVRMNRLRIGVTYTIGDQDYDSFRFGGSFQF